MEQWTKPTQPRSAPGPAGVPMGVLRAHDDESPPSDRLRILLVTCAPSEPHVQARIKRVCAHPHYAGHTILVCVPPHSLSLEHATEANDAGVDYVFIQQGAGALLSPLGSWATLLRRFRPHAIHLFPDVAPSLARKLAASARTRQRPPIPVLVEADARAIQAVAGGVNANTTETRHWLALCRQPATRLICHDSHALQWCQERLSLPAARLFLLLGDAENGAGTRHPDSVHRVHVDYLEDEGEPHRLAADVGGPGSALLADRDEEVKSLFRIYERVRGSEANDRRQDGGEMSLTSY